MNEQTSNAPDVWIFHTTSGGVRNTVDVRLVMDVTPEQIAEKARPEYVRNFSAVLRSMSRLEVDKINADGTWTLHASRFHDRSRGLSPVAAMRRVQKDAQAGNLTRDELAAFAKQMADMAAQMGNGDENAGA